MPICTGEVKYVTCLNNTDKLVLEAERNKDQPTFELFREDKEQTIVIKVWGLRSAKMRSSKPKAEHSDIYILKPSAEILRQGVEDIHNYISRLTTPDRGLREPKDPESLYLDSGPPLRIESTEPWVKPTIVIGCFASEGFAIESIRRGKRQGATPILNIDVEHLGRVQRLHLGLQVDWEKTNKLPDKENSITVIIPWSESEHLLSSLNSAVGKFI